MEDSILITIKKLLDISENCHDFDVDLLTHINSTIATLDQLGVGYDELLFVTDDSTTWEELFGNDNRLGFVRTYVYLKVRLLFDPPQSSAVMETIKETIKELEWRINSVAENKN